MKIKLLFQLSLLLLAHSVQAQTWYFGSKAGIVFNGGSSPVSVTSTNNTNVIYSLEGTAMANDASGNLLFYTDGQTAYYKDGTPIPFGSSASANVLGGNSGSTQCAVIVPVPETGQNNCSKKYYVFTVKEALEKISGFTVNQLEFTSAYPKGIITKQKLLLSTTRLSEKITAVNDGSGGYWLLTHGFDDNQTANSETYYKLHITPGSSFPADADIIGQKVGSSHSGTEMNAAGQLKFSIDGKTVAAALYLQNMIDLLSFNPGTGILNFTAAIKNVANQSGGVIYGLEFSPNTKYLYATSIAGTYKGLYQINLSTPGYPITVIQNGTGSSFEFGLLQIGPDKKIYSANMNEENGFLGIVNDPNQAACNYNRRGLQLLAGKSTLGLPTVIQNEARCGEIITDIANTACGCQGSANLVVNGDFENGLTGFTSKFSQMNTALLPGTYTVAEYASYKKFCSNWDISNPGSCPRTGGMQGKFLVVNGQTGSNGAKAVWGQSINVEPGKDYKICMNLKNLAQCCFDVKPVVSILYNDGTQQKTLGPVTVNQSNNSCDWLKFTATISIPAGQSNNIALPINIVLDQSGQGDGNDLAIDDISLIQLKPFISDLTDFDISTQTINATQYNITAMPKQVLPPGAGYSWEVFEIDPQTGAEIPGTKMSNPSSWWTPVCKFPGFGSGTPGIFEATKMYRIVRGTWSDCNSWSAISYDIRKNLASGRIEVKKNNTYVPVKAN